MGGMGGWVGWVDLSFLCLGGWGGLITTLSFLCLSYQVLVLGADGQVGELQMGKIGHNQVVAKGREAFA